MTRHSRTLEIVTYKLTADEVRRALRAFMESSGAVLTEKSRFCFYPGGSCEVETDYVSTESEKSLPPPNATAKETP